jgi:hypothetical protein
MTMIMQRDHIIVTRIVKMDKLLNNLHPMIVTLIG